MNVVKGTNEKQTLSSVPVWSAGPVQSSGGRSAKTLLASHPLSRQLVTSRPLMLLSYWEALQWALPKGATLRGPLVGLLGHWLMLQWAHPSSEQPSISDQKSHSAEVSGTMVQAESE